MSDDTKGYDQARLRVRLLDKDDDIALTPGNHPEASRPRPRIDVHQVEPRRFGRLAGSLVGLSVYLTCLDG